MIKVRYEKPTVVRVALAAEAVQGGKGISTALDNAQYTVAAYEADE